MARRGLFFIVIFGYTMTLFAESALKTETLKRGVDLYGRGEWREAILELRKTATLSNDPMELAEASYWIAMSEMNTGEYEAALEDIDRILAYESNGLHYLDAMYQKGRILFYLGRQDEAILLLRAFIEKNIEEGPRSAAYYWIGESLFSLGRLEEARTIFTLVIDQYPESTKYQSASYRIALIDQKAVESELLKLLKWSHEESLKTVEEYQKRERSYEQAIIAYQKRITEMMKDTRLADLEIENTELKAKYLAMEVELHAEKVYSEELNTQVKDLSGREAKALQKITVLEKEISNTRASITVPTIIEAPAPIPVTNTEKVNRLLALKSEALNIKELIVNRLLQKIGNNEGVR